MPLKLSQAKLLTKEEAEAARAEYLRRYPEVVAFWQSLANSVGEIKPSGYDLRAEESISVMTTEPVETEQPNRAPDGVEGDTK